MFLDRIPLVFNIIIHFVNKMLLECYTNVKTVVDQLQILYFLWLQISQHFTYIHPQYHITVGGGSRDQIIDHESEKRVFQIFLIVV